MPTSKTASTQKELFDVVDGHDCVLYQEKRSTVHEKQLRHRAVHIFVFNKSGQLYLQRRSINKDTAPGKWVSSCSGHVDSGEDYDTSARRELGEELGLHETSDLKRIFKESPCIQTGYEFVWVYTCKACGPFKLDPLEVSDGQWVDLKRLNKWLEERPRDFAWSFNYLWAKFRSMRELRK